MTRMFISSSTMQQYGNIVCHVITSSKISQRCVFKPSRPETTPGLTVDVHITVIHWKGVSACVTYTVGMYSPGKALVV